MKVVNHIKDVKQEVKNCKLTGKSIGFVPTMGFLHAGHASLIKKAREENDFVIVSVFVNPIQFGPNEDLASYPRDLEADSSLCASLGVDLLFHPTAEEMYDQTLVYVDVENMSNHLCGAKRLGHFRGVCTVVTKLFNITEADRGYFGQKDAQQLAILKKLVKDLNLSVEIRPCPIIREEDGLAKSSRNSYLNEEERKAALCLSKSIFNGEQYLKENLSQYGKLDSKALISWVENILKAEKMAKIDYIEVVDLESMEPVEVIADKPVLVAIAVYIGKTRLIDNFIWEGNYHYDK